MKKNYILFLLFGFYISGLNATVITVDNNYPSIGNSTTLQEGHDSANNGDTIYVTPSNAIYEGITVIKSLIIIGCGFESTQNGMKITSINGSMNFYSGSEGSVIQGFGGQFNIDIDANSIHVNRNKINHINISSGHHSILISQNFIIDNSSNFLVNIGENNGIVIANNIFTNRFHQWSWNFYSGGNGISANYSSISISLVNNVFDFYKDLWGNPVSCTALDMQNSNAEIFNNIIVAGNINVNPQNYWNNLSYGQVDMNTVFVDYSNYNFHLKEDSPAKGTGVNGTDMGIYGGSLPFVDGGFPNLPMIYYLDVPLTGNQQNGINVTIKARTNN